MSQVKRKRLTVTVNDDFQERVKYWASKHGVSINEYVLDAVEKAIAHENKDYDLPLLEVQRLNQIVDALTVLSQNQQSLEQVVVSGFDSLLGLTRGDNYLLEDESGDL